jgi:hypothetical protein
MQVFISGLLTKLLHVPFSMQTLWLQDLKKYKLRGPSSFHYLNQSACIKVDGINDAEEYLATRKAMDTVGITEQEQVQNSSSLSLVTNCSSNVDVGSGQ